MTALLFTLATPLLFPRPAAAQWIVTDQHNNRIPTNDGSNNGLFPEFDGSYSLTGGDVSGWATNTYPPPNPRWPDVYAFSPNPITSPHLYPPNRNKPFPNTDLLVRADGAATTGDGVTNGNVTSSVAGTQWAIWKWTGRQRPSDHIDILLTSSLNAEVQFDYYPFQSTDLYGTASASDSLGDKDQVDTNSTPGVLGNYMTEFGHSRYPAIYHHLLRVPVTNVKGVWEAPVSLGEKASESATIPAFCYDYYTRVNANSNIFAYAQLDNREVTLRRIGEHGDTTDSSGTTYGATTYSWVSAASSPGSTGHENIQTLVPEFAGNWRLNPNFISNGTPPTLNISWIWGAPNTNDQNLNLNIWNKYDNHVPVGTVMRSTQGQWVGRPDHVKHIVTHYTATDLSDGATATATYDLAVHDQYDNFRRVDSHGHPMASRAPGDPGALTQIGQDTIPAGSGQPVVTYDLNSEPIKWDAVGDIGGGVLVATSAGAVATTVVVGTAEVYAWPLTILNLIGLTLQSAASYPAEPTLVGPQVWMDEAFFEKAYHNYLYTINALPGQEVNFDNMMDPALATILHHQNPPDFDGYYAHAGTQLTATVYLEMLNYYFYADQYDAGGRVSTTAASTVYKPGRFVWSYLWKYGGPPSSRTVTTPTGPGNPPQ